MVLGCPSAPYVHRHLFESQNSMVEPPMTHQMLVSTEKSQIIVSLKGAIHEIIARRMSQHYDDNQSASFYTRDLKLNRELISDAATSVITDFRYNKEEDAKIKRSVNRLTYKMIKEVEAETDVFYNEQCTFFEKKLHTCHAKPKYDKFVENMINYYTVQYNHAILMQDWDMKTPKKTPRIVPISALKKPFYGSYGKRKGWKHESYRHSLSQRRIRTAARKRNK